MCHPAWSSDVVGPYLIGLHTVLLPGAVDITDGLSCSLNPCFWYLFLAEDLKASDRVCNMKNRLSQNGSTKVSMHSSDCN